MPAVSRITLHHTAELAGMATRTDAELVRGIQTFHQDGRGWADIGYHYVIGRDGNVYEGRELGVQGAHAGAGNNEENLGISLIGDFTASPPDARQLETTRLFLIAQQERYGVPMAEVYGHREFKPTECPGSALFAWLEAYRAEAIEAV
jgi:N-acetylmuramoyl-L-alanine amidase